MERRHARDCKRRRQSGMFCAMNDLKNRILHAESYPFARPACSYLLRRGSMHPLPEGATANRTPVIASGSNASPERLRAKFGDDQEIPVTRAELKHFAVVFAGHFTAYGAISRNPSTPTRAPSPTSGSPWLTPKQLVIMHRSEGVIECREAVQRYDYVELASLDLRPERMAPVAMAGAYLSKRMFAPDGKPVRFAEVAATPNRLSARSHRSTLRHAAQLLEPSKAFHDFMDHVFSGVAERQALFERLTPFTIPREIGSAP